MKRLLLIFLVACGSTPPPKVPPVPTPKPEPQDSVVIITPIPPMDTTITLPEPHQEYDTIPVIILYSDTLLRTGIYSVAAMDGYEVVSKTPFIRTYDPVLLTYSTTYVQGDIVAYLDTEKEPIYKSYLVWQTKKR